MNCIDLFAGAGGFSTGATMAGAPRDQQRFACHLTPNDRHKRADTAQEGAR